MPPVVDSTMVPEASCVWTEATGQQITAQTRELFLARERMEPGIINSAVVFFRSLQEHDLLHRLGRNQSNRCTLHSRAHHHASNAQHDVIAWLRNGRGEARQCFADCSDFSFDVDRHVRSLTVTNALVLPATSALVEELSRFREVVAVEENYWIKGAADDIRTPVCMVRLLGCGGSPAFHRDGYTWGWHSLGLPEIHRAGFKGFGIRLGIANSGVHDAHADLVFKLKDFAKVQYCFEPVGNGNPRSFGLYMIPERGGFPHDYQTTAL